MKRGSKLAQYEGVSASVIKRLPRYYRFLRGLIEKDIHRISSKELAKLMDLTASQIRQDLNCFGGFGQQGYGYNVNALYQQIAKILGIDKSIKTILIGAGNLGLAIANHVHFENIGFHLSGIFDVNPNVVGQNIKGIRVSHVSSLSEFCEKNKPQVAILCIPRETAQEITNNLVDLGIKGFWNFSHFDIKVHHDDVIVENVHLGDSLMTLCFGIHQLNGDTEDKQG